MKDLYLHHFKFDSTKEDHCDQFEVWPNWGVGDFTGQPVRNRSPQAARILFIVFRCMGRGTNSTFQAPVPDNLNEQFSAVARSYS